MSSKLISRLFFSKPNMEIRKKILLIACVLISLFGLAFIYFSALAVSPSETKISKIDSSLNGKLISTTGKISYVRTHSAGHVFLTLTDGDSRIEVPIFSSLMNQLKANGITQYDFKKGKTVRITGIVGEYKGQLQIVPRKASDIQILNSLK
jgi:DNA/RNA endonuclease YhcR with UshA esterase domain